MKRLSWRVRSREHPTETRCAALGTEDSEHGETLFVSRSHSGG